MAMITAVESFVLGSALDLVAPSVMVLEVAQDIAPRLSTVVARLPAGRGRADHAFEIGLRSLISGFRELLDQRRC